MKKHFLTLLMIAFLLTAAAAAADSAILVTQYEKYMCGDQFELEFPDVIATSSMFSNTSRVHAKADHDERLLQVRVKLRNMTTETFAGMNKDSCKLIGHIRDRSLSYTPELINNTDYFGSGNYYSWDKIPPLRMIDVLLVFRVKPTLINWELSFDPQVNSGQIYTLDTVTYDPMDWEPCQALFQFPLIRTLETGELTRFVR